jgi:hypothetical protein
MHETGTSSETIKNKVIDWVKSLPMEIAGDGANADSLGGDMLEKSVLVFSVAVYRWDPAGEYNSAGNCRSEKL